MDAFKEFGFRAVVFHTTSGKAIPEGRWPFANTIQPILFLSRLLTLAEKNYWSTELETAGFIWVVKKVRYIIKSSKSNVIIQTDNSAIIEILQQLLIISTTLTIRLNLRLVQASQFF